MREKSSLNISGGEFTEQAKEVLAIEGRAVATLVDKLGEEFVRAVNLILTCRGRIVVTGMGKSGHIGRKFAATLCSTGTPALFLHPAEGVHGDLGAITEGDLLIALSYGGETEELNNILPAVKRLGISIIALCGQCESELARRADVFLDISVEEEACPMNLAPTASTTAMLAMGDALAIAVMTARKFGREDFKKLHPAGRLGRRMLLRVGDLMRTADGMAVVHEGTPMQEVLFSITSAHAGAAAVVDDTGKLAGIVADGDIRRYLLSNVEGLKKPARDAMTPQPKTTVPSQLATEALLLMEKHQIGDLPVVDEGGKPLGMLDLKDLLRAGIV